MFDNSPDAMLVVDEAGEIVRANDRVEDLFDYEPSSAEGKAVESLLPEGLRGGRSVEQEADSGDSAIRTMGAGPDRGRRRDGTTFPADVRLRSVETDDGCGVVAAVREITGREARTWTVRTLMDVFPDAVAITDAASGDVVEVNDRAADLVDRPESDLLGRPVTAFHPDEDEARYRDLFRRHVKAGHASTAHFPDGDDLYVETADRERVPVEITGQVTEVDGREVFVEILRDVSDRKAHEEKLREKIGRIESLSHMLSHDLRTPLSVAKGGVSLARDTGDVSELEQVGIALARIEDILDDSLTMIEEGYEVDSVEPLGFEALVSSCWENVATGDGDLRVPTDGTVYADPKRVRNLFENLFQNAIEHGGEDVTVRAGVYVDGFFVADDGPGLPDGHEDSVTEPGWTTVADGTGLGLNIVSEIASAHGWTLSVGESQTGGARFDVGGVRTSVGSDSDATRTAPRR